MENTEGKNFNDSLLSTAAGRYSVSRINIVTGIVQLVVWTLILLSRLILFPVIVCDAGESVLFWLNTVILYLLLLSLRSLPRNSRCGARLSANHTKSRKRKKEKTAMRKRTIEKLNFKI